MSDYVIVNGELRHFGTKGMKWGVRRYQNSDGTLTAAGKKRYDGDWDSKSHRPKSTTSKTSGSKGSSKAGNNDEPEKKGLTDKQKRAIKIGAAAVGTAVAVYGAYKVSDMMKDKAFEKAYRRATEATDKYMKMYDSRNVYPHIDTRDFDKLRDAKKKSNDLLERLVDDDHSYAKRASKNTISAIKELLNKNDEPTTSQLMAMGPNMMAYTYKKFK